MRSQKNHELAISVTKYGLKNTCKYSVIKLFTRGLRKATTMYNTHEFHFWSINVAITHKPQKQEYILDGEGQCTPKQYMGLLKETIII